MNRTSFQSAFAAHLEGFITHKRAIGYRYEVGAAILNRFDGFCSRYHGSEQTLSKGIVTHWAEHRPGEATGTQGIRIGPVRQFAHYLHNLGYEAYMIPDRMLPTARRYIPYVFSNGELAAFFFQIDACRVWGGNTVRHNVMPVLFRLLYCCGLRVSEATALKRKHVDLHSGVLTVYGGKFNKDRRVPMTDELTGRCRALEKSIHSLSDGESYFLGSSSGGRPLLNHRRLKSAGFAPVG